MENINELRNELMNLEYTVKMDKRAIQECRANGGGRQLHKMNIELRTKLKRLKYLKTVVSQ